MSTDPRRSAPGPADPGPDPGSGPVDPAAAAPASRPRDPGAAEVNATAASLLGFLHDGPKTGWDLCAAAEQVIGPFWSLTRSQVYRELSAMAERGLVEAGPSGRRDRRPYGLTEAGRAAFAAWAEQGPGQATIRLPLLLFVTLGRHIPAEQLARTLAEQRRMQAGSLTDYLRLRDELREHHADPYLLATLDYGISVARATVRWIDRLPPEVLGGTEPAEQTEQASRTGQSAQARQHEADEA
ncbi:PadR family transcriptional regulator [Streptomyces sp. NA04227]|uniref:PadR family transcriptional regulator n=1 Tax=Streptomyces sp. NA04227 TaxID=2742136 RepID=UPI0015907BE2|nr:PadR family transcriptional regulator [Streptomyces sp. NA04227]QKW08765.1 PadR family transcriptional regulator [Streptomyces sp. NA04227]